MQCGIRGAEFRSRYASVTAWSPTNLEILFPVLGNSARARPAEPENWKLSGPLTTSSTHEMS